MSSCFRGPRRYFAPDSTVINPFKDTLTSRATLSLRSQSRKEMWLTGEKYDWLATWSRLKKAKWLTDDLSQYDWRRRRLYDVSQHRRRLQRSPDLPAGFEAVVRGKEKEERGKKTKGRVKEGKRKGREGKRKWRKEKGKGKGRGKGKRKGKGEMVPHFLVQSDANVS